MQKKNFITAFMEKNFLQVFNLAEKPNLKKNIIFALNLPKFGPKFFFSNFLQKIKKTNY